MNQLSTQTGFFHDIHLKNYLQNIAIFAHFPQTGNKIIYFGLKKIYFREKFLKAAVFHLKISWLVLIRLQGGSPNLKPKKVDEPKIQQSIQDS